MPARRSEFCQAIKPVTLIRVAVPGSVKQTPRTPTAFLPRRLSWTEIPPSLNPEMKACPSSPFGNRRETEIRTGTRTDRRRSRFIRDLAARKLDLARSEEIGL